MRELGLNGYRFSIAWPRVLPEGRGRVNEAGLDFYDRLVDELLVHGIRPFVTLFHWDTPQPLEDAGGWASRDIVGAFGEFTEAVARRLGDRVEHWITINEPFVHAWLGYGWGLHAPGRMSEQNAFAAAHHELLAHGLAVEVLRRESPAADVGITLNLDPVYAASEDPADVETVRRYDGFLNRFYLDAIFRGSYPEDVLESYAPQLPIVDGDLRTIAAPIDFLGINNYTKSVLRASPDPRRPRSVRDPDALYTQMGWEVAPDSFYDLLVRVHDEYAPGPIYITENGAAFPDVLGHDGRIRDTKRRAYLEAYLASAARAIAEGVPLKGYFVWSLLDNFEWAHGYRQRFGIVYVDFATLERIPKASAYWYRDFIASQRKEAQAWVASV